jgi:hypothetical protein
MRAWLRATLAATVLTSAGLALWPTDEPEALLPVARLRPATDSLPRTEPTAAAASLGSVTASSAAQLPTRPADWPEPPATALAAWQAAPPPPPRPLAKAPPTAAAAAPARPAFPYRWIGQLDDGGPPQVLLASQQRSVAVRLGATLDDRWRLLRSDGGVLQAQALPDGEVQDVPGAPPASEP